MITKFILIIAMTISGQPEPARVIDTRLYETTEACQLSGEVMIGKAKTDPAGREIEGSEIICEPVPYDPTWDVLK